MTRDEMYQYANEVARRAADIAYNPQENNYLRHRLSDEANPVEVDYGPAILTLIFPTPELSPTIASFIFQTDFTRGMSPDIATLEYLERAVETELPLKTQEFEAEMLQKFPELRTKPDMEVLQTCAEMGIPYSLLVFAEDQQNEQEIPFLFHPAFVRPSYALAMLKMFAKQRLEKLRHD